MKKILRFLGIEGRTTIPLSIRFALGLQAGDIISFTQDDSKIILQKEKLCTNCIENQKATIADFIDSLTPKEQRDVLVALTLKLSERTENK